MSEPIQPGGDLLILDGGTGTELQQRGVPMDGDVWCAAANLTHGDAVREVHSAYIDAGARVITANTYASSPLSFQALGRETEIAAIDRTAVRLAREAVGDRPVAVAGSISVMPAVAPGSDRNTAPELDRATLLPLYHRKAEELAAAGCDLLLLEMMRDTEVSAWAVEAAIATGLPVWVGLAIERDAAGNLHGYAHPQCAIDDLIEALLQQGVMAALVMHTEPEVVDAALPALARRWDGPLGAYPEAGYFEMPDWVFRDLSPEDFVAACERWRALGATILGGCCGITPAHIHALARALGPALATG